MKKQLEEPSLIKGIAIGNKYDTDSPSGEMQVYYPIRTDNEIYVKELYIRSNINEDDEKSTRLIDYIYPIGSIYLTIENIDPSISWPETEWELLPANYYLMITNESQAGQTGGRDNVTLKLNNLPKHSHTIPKISFDIPNHTHGFNTTINLSHSHDLNNNTTKSAPHYFDHFHGDGYAYVTTNGSGISELEMATQTGSGHYSPYIKSAKAHNFMASDMSKHVISNTSKNIYTAEQSTAANGNYEKYSSNFYHYHNLYGNTSNGLTSDIAVKGTTSEAGKSSISISGKETEYGGGIDKNDSIMLNPLHYDVYAWKRVK